MEQVDYKEKYKDLIKRIKKMVNCQPTITKLAIESLFPELKESEDEIVIAALKSGINGLLKKEYHLKGIGGISFDRIIAWLEKQGEHANFLSKIQVGDKVTRNEDGELVNLSQLARVAKPADKVEPKFKDGDEIKTKNGESFTITRIDRWGYWSEDLFICNFDDADKWELVKQKPIEKVNGEDYGIDGLWHAQRILEKTLGEVEGYQTDDGILDHKAAITAVKKLYEQKPTEWSEDDVAMLDSAIAFVEHSAFTTIGKGKNNVIAWLKSIKDKAQPQLEQDFTDDDKEQIKKISEAINNYYPYNESSEMRIWLNSIKDRIEWLKSIISRQQPKQEWSEENNDEAWLNDIICKVESDCTLNKDEITWLKSLRPQSQWKPSDEQFHWLKWAINRMPDTEKANEAEAVLEELLEDLKKLNGE